MILRKDFFLLSSLLLICLVHSEETADAKNYDENEWIPIAPKHAQSAQPVVDVEKKATGRVLNLAEPPANSFFPEEVKAPKNGNNFQQYLRETTTFQKRPVEQPLPPQLPVRIKQQQQHPYKFESNVRPESGGRQTRPAKPQKEFYAPQVQQPAAQHQFVQYYQPNEYHTIPEEYLNQRPDPQALPQQQYFQNFEIPDLPPIRLNATPSRFEKRPKPVSQVELPTKAEDHDNVQLLYVPLESLGSQHGNIRPVHDLPRLHAYQQTPAAEAPPQFLNYRPPPAKQQQIHNIENDFAKQALEAHKLQLQLQQQPQIFPEREYVYPTEVVTEQPSTTTTTKKPVSKKRKAHQPPLAVYMGGASTSDVNEVLALLKDARTIDVQDTVGPHSPKIFVGPSNLEAPRGYTKFELPYLSSLDGNRVERKIEQYPFFVAPLSYKAPAGYSKIPLPSPHVGSVVIKEKEATRKPAIQQPVPHVQQIQEVQQTRQPQIQQHQQLQSVRHQSTTPHQPQRHSPPQAQTEIYQQFSLQDQPQFEYQTRPTPAVASTPPPRFSKPIPEEHVIKQHEIDEINSFIPQFTENVRIPDKEAHRFQETAQRGHHQQREPEVQQQREREPAVQQHLHQRVRESEAPQIHQQRGREPEVSQIHKQRGRVPEVQQVPEKYEIESFSRPQTTRHSTVRFSTPQPLQHLTENQFIDEILQQQHKPTAVPVHQEVHREEYVNPALTAIQDEGQYLKEVTRPHTSQEYTSEEDSSQYTGSTRGQSTTRSRPTPTPAPVEHYEEEITKPPTRVRTRPTKSQSHVRESYDAPTRTTHLRRGPTTPPATTHTEDQYLKETVIEPRPKARPTTEKPKYSILEQFSIGRSTTPSSLHYTPSSVEYEEEVQSHRPVIYKYKQSEELVPEYQQPVYHSSTPKPRENQHQLNQDTLDAKVLTHETSGNFVTGPAQPHVYHFQAAEEYEEQPQQVKTQNANVENYNIAQTAPAAGAIHNLINNLEDQSVRQLLQPGLIPTSPKPAEIGRYEVSTHVPIAPITPEPVVSHYPSTHLPHVETVETTTQRRVVTRGRNRGSRYTTTTQSPQVSSTRRAPVTRGRRPLPSRTRYVDDSETTTSHTLVRSTTDPTKRIVTSRSRFRTRGRPIAETTDRVSATYEQDATPAHIQSNHVPSVQIIEPQVTQRVNQDFINYRPVYNVPADQELVLINNKKVTKPATEPVVIHQINQLPIKNLEEENTENTSSRLRGRRPSTTAAPQTVTARKYESEPADNDEFYGFFRNPSFKKPTETAPAAETVRPLYSSTYVSSTLKPQVREEELRPEVRYHSSTENVHFVGEIRPKYQATAQYFEASQPSISTERYNPSTQREEVVEEEKPRVRQRVRIPTRPRGTPSPVSAPIEEKRKGNDETVTQRGRIRGKTHYRMPMKPKRPVSESSEDEDVEGGNYPVNFKNFHTTPRPSFQITVDPLEDQEGFQSIYRPTYIAKDSSKVEIGKESGAGRFVENYQLVNFIPSEIKLQEDIPIALPSIASAPEVNQVIQDEQKKAAQEDANIEKIVNEMMQDYDDNTDTIDQTEKAMPTIIASEVVEDFDESVTTNSPLPETTTPKKRRGVWKLVRRPTDVLEGAESQNPASNNNLFNSVEEKPAKVQPIQTEYTTLPMTTESEVTTQVPVTTTTEAGFFDSLYNMFEDVSEKKSPTESHYEDEDDTEVTTIGKTVEPVVLPEFVPLVPEELPNTTYFPEVETEPEIQPELEPEPLPTTSTTTTTTTEAPIVKIDTTTPLTSMTYITPMSFETWNLKTSTSTEISHETEICYKGKCIKSKDMKVPL